MSLRPPRNQELVLAAHSQLKRRSTPNSGRLQRHRHGRHWPPALPFYHSHAAAALGESHSPSRISKMVLSTVKIGPLPHTVDTAIFEMWLGSLSRHQGLSIPVV